MLLLFLLVISLIRAPPPPANKVHILSDGSTSCSNPNYPTIDAALLGVLIPHETIVVCCGIHSYSNSIIVNKNFVKIVGKQGCPGHKPRIRFTDPCSNKKVRADNVTIHNLEFEKTQKWLPSCEDESKYAISFSRICGTIYENLEIKHCEFTRGFHGHVFVRSKGSLVIEHNIFAKALEDSIRIAHMVRTLQNNKLYIKHNRFSGWSQNAINFKRISSCPNDKIKGMDIKILGNLADGKKAIGIGNNFFNYEIWNVGGLIRRDVSPPYNNRLEVKLNRITKLRNKVFLLNRPKNFCQTFNCDHVKFIRNVGRRAMAGLLVDFKVGSTPPDVPPLGSIFCFENEFCDMSGMLGGIFLTPTEYDIGYTLAHAPGSAALTMFNAIGNTICTCFGHVHSNPEACDGHGDCVGRDLCLCDENYGGDECDEVTGCDEQCQGGCEPHGHCECHEVDDRRSVKCHGPHCPPEIICECVCDDPVWTGECCDEPLIPPGCPQLCCENGVCNDQTGVCTCDIGFAQPDCCFSECCNGSGCSEPHGGSCLPALRRTVGWECVCNQGYGEESCCVGCGECSGQCQHGGSCGTVGRRTLGCVCQGTDHHGDCCEIPDQPPPCPPDCPTGCLNEGVCHQDRRSPQFHCVCPPGFAPPCCEPEQCGPHCPLDCSGHGACRGGQCSCSPGWDGNCCHHQGCCEGDCGLNGTCIRYEGNAVCQCDPGLSGPCCDSDSSFHCCQDDTIIIRGDGNGEGCGSHGLCYGDILFGQFYCICDEGWGPGGRQNPDGCCDHTRCCEGEGCGENGDCTFDEFFGWRCECRNGWSGPCCQNPPCYEQCGEALCGEHGHCVCDEDQEEEGVLTTTPPSLCHCECNPGFYGPCCTEDADPLCCHGEGCHGHGVCECEQYPPIIIIVDDDFEDDDDDDDDDHGHGHGHGHGQSQDEEHGHGGYDGHGHGGHHNGGNCRCTCEEGWSKKCCNDPTLCHGILSTEERVCCGHGICWDDDTCICNEGWWGKMCCLPTKEFTCCGWPAHHKRTCRGHGKCVGQNECECDEGWWGKYCGDKKDPITCFGYPHEHEHVCSSHGECINDDTCDCVRPWFGLECSKKRRPPTCFGYHAYEPAVCDGHGDCVKKDLCECHEDPEFRGRPQGGSHGDGDRGCWEEEHGCHGHGECDGHGECHHYGHWMGIKCQDRITCFDIPRPLPGERRRRHKHCQYHRHPHCDSGDDECIHHHERCGRCPFNHELGECNKCHHHDFDDFEPCDHDGMFPLFPDDDQDDDDDDEGGCENHHDFDDDEECDWKDHETEWCNKPRCQFDHGDHGHPGEHEECDSKCRPIKIKKCKPKKKKCKHKKRPCCGHGECIGYNECECEEGWTGRECCRPDDGPQFKCFNIPKCSPRVCCRHGTCVEQDECECDEHWHGDECCDTLMCFDIPFSDPEVCSGHGECVEEDTCDCDPNYVCRRCEIEFHAYQCYTHHRVVKVCHETETLTFGTITEGWILHTETISIEYEKQCKTWNFKNVDSTNETPTITFGVPSTEIRCSITFPECYDFEIPIPTEVYWISSVIGFIILVILFICCVLVIFTTNVIKRKYE